MNETWDEISLKKLIDDEVEENLNLEYKSADSLGKSDGKKKEISKDVSAFANSDGGVILYGMKEYDEPSKRHLPEIIDPINRNEFSKEWLEQIINSNIHPRISNLIIKPINISSHNESVVYAVEILKSNTAHQANDKRYYKRFNFESVAMDDYEIKDILNRAQHPVIEIEFKIVVEDYEVKPIISLPKIQLLDTKEDEEPKIKTDTTLYVYGFNNGKVFANYVNCFLDIPIELIREGDYKKSEMIEIDDKKYKRIYCDNTTRDVVDVKNSGYLSIPKYGPARFEPILPKTRSKLTTVLFNNDVDYSELKILWTVYADNAEPIDGEINMEEILIERIYPE
ncbi:MAG: ATP-binding protein [Bacteroidetes bacterium]|nr:ATP-binding protein [Bacteroidota bacterium]